MHYRFLRYPGGKAKAVTLSFDDGCRQDLEMVQHLNRHGMKCTFNLNTCHWHMTPEEIRTALLDAGHEVAVHGKWHMAPGCSRDIDAIQDVLNCRLELEAAFGRIIRGMAYPDTGITQFHNGASYERIRRYLRELGIVYARTLGGDNDSFLLPTDFYAWMPTAHHHNPAVFDYAKDFMALDVDGQYCALRYPRLFYLWGHSYEFENDWPHLETLCAALGDREDVWYATNMEIYDYVQAYDALVFSADGRRVSNPSLLTVWFDADGALYSIAPGETRSIG